jgi:hypothetical protein
MPVSFVFGTMFSRPIKETGIHINADKRVSISLKECVQISQYAT